MTELSPLVERLQEALRRKNRSPYWLQRELAKQGVTGSSTGSMSRYMRGEITPPLEFLQAAAQTLGVFEPWLLSGYGHPEQQSSAPRADPYGARLGEANERMQRIVDGWAEDDRNVEYRIADRFFGFRSLRETTRAVVLELFERCGQYTDERLYCVVPWDRFQTRYGLDLEVARRLGSILSAPIEMLRLDDLYPPYELSDERFNQYVLACCAAISCLLPERSEPTEAEVAEWRRWYETRQKSMQKHREEHQRKGRVKRRSTRSKRKSPASES